MFPAKPVTFQPLLVTNLTTRSICTSTYTCQKKVPRLWINNYRYFVFLRYIFAQTSRYALWVFSLQITPCFLLVLLTLTNLQITLFTKLHFSNFLVIEWDRIHRIRNLNEIKT